MKKVAMPRYFAAIIATLLFFNLQAQSFKSNLELADEAYEARNFYTAAQYYLNVFDELKAPEDVAYPYGTPSPEKKNEEFDTYQYVMERLALSYYNYRDYREAEKWYAKVTALEEYSDIENLINYGICLRANEKYNEAVVFLKRAKNKHKPRYFKNSEGEEIEDEATKGITKKIEFELACAEFAVEQIEKSTALVPELLDTIFLNTPDASNYAGTLMDNNKMMFTTTRFVNQNPTSKKYGNYRNSIMTYHMLDSSLQAIEFGFGLDRNAAAPSMTRDGEWVYLTAWSNETPKPEYRIFVSKPLNDSIWEEPKPLNEIVNTPGTNSKHGFVTRDGKGMYFSSDRKEGLGGYDIYYVRLGENGQPYGRAVNLGPNINTTEDDEAPFFDAVSQTLYFSTKGRIGMGGLDVFYSERNGANWGLAKNMGYPLNSTMDDSYFMTTENDNIGFISSDRGSTCCYRLYTFEMAYYYAGGAVLDAVDDSYLPDVRVTLLDSAGETEVAVAYTDEMGHYTLPIAKGRGYKVEYHKEKFLDDEQFFFANQVAPNDTLGLDMIKLITTEIGRAVKLENIFYDFGKATLREESKAVLSKLVRQLKKYPYLVIEIGSHTDHIGSNSYNRKLSNARSQSVVDFMVSEGIDPDMIVAKGYGESQPKVPNTNPDGSDNPENRQINRRTEFKVLEYRFDQAEE